MTPKDTILQRVEDEDVRFIRLQFTDMLGRMRNMAITVDKLNDALDNLCIFDGSAIDGFANIEESDLYLHPDPTTFAIFPWRPHNGKVARLICDVYTPDGQPLEYNPRLILERVLKEAEEMGFTFKIGPEMEFFLFNTDEIGRPTTETNDHGSYFDIAPLDNGENTRRDICLTLEDMGYVIEASHHEMARGQHEIVFKADDALTTADRIITSKMVIKTIAKRNGLHATFMPKPFANEWGSGMHLNMWLETDGKNVFEYNPAEKKFPDAAYRFIAGLLHYTREISCLTNPTVNSYRRFIQGADAPCHISWSENNRSLLIRAIRTRKPENSLIEYRSPDGTANPYLAIAAILKAGLEGIKDSSIVLPPSIGMNVCDITEEEKSLMGIKKMPVSLNEALKIARDSKLIEDILGAKLKEHYIANKEAEYDDYRRAVSQWELDRYLVQY
ncbi:MAG: type I glutamate--ammonia ligase [Clostridiales bacterium]|nr:type I glutamate--ammonia ligase [Clostridiales bacterium]